MALKKIPRTGFVLLFVKPRFSSQRERINGVYAAAIRRGWQIMPVEESPTRAALGKYRQLWQPIGCLVDQSVMEGRMGKALFDGLPTVFIGRDTARKVQIFDCSHQDVRKTAELAAAEFRRLGLVRFAFVGDPERPFWSVERGMHFREALAGMAFSEYGGDDPSTLDGRREMVGWLRRLPLPCGCLLAADHVAPAFYAAAADAGLRIGEDLPTISVDDDEATCLSLSPRLSSVKLDYFRSGENAIALLERRLADPGRPPECVLYPSLGLVRRASATLVFADHRVTRGMAFITDHGCEPIALDDVAAVMGCGRRLAISLFRSHARQTILDAIRSVRLEKAFALLRDGRIAIDAIPCHCGYAASPACFKTYFKRVTGLTMREWREQTGRAHVPRAGGARENN